MSAQYPITAVFLDGSTPTEGEPLLPFAQDLAVPQWTDGTLSIVAVGSDGEAFDISGGAFIFTARTRNQAAPPVISHEGDIDDGAAGLAHVDIGSVDVGIDVQTLSWSLAFVDSDGKVWGTTAQGSFSVVAAEYIPGQDVTVPESQQPLAEGPQGEQGIQGIQGDPGTPTVPNSFPDITAVDPTLYAGALAFDELTERLAISYGGDWIYVTMEAP